MSDLLNKPIVRMPALSPGTWLNSPPLTKEQLHGQVVLVDFWDYTCINCVRTLPYLIEWHQRYAGKGLIIIGIHAPEFNFAHDATQLMAAIQQFALPYPVLLDNSFQNWDNFANRAWPTKYLIDTNGYIRYQRSGEGFYAETERAIQQLLRLRQPDVALPEIMPALRPEDQHGAVCYRPTPELHAGYQAGLFGGALGNSEGYLPHRPIIYRLPLERPLGRFYVAGIWQAHPQSLEFVGQTTGQVVLPYQAVGVNLVISPTADEVALRLGLLPEILRLIFVEQDGAWVKRENAGTDLQFDPANRSYIAIDRPRLFSLIQNPTFATHEITLTLQTTGIALYAFSFTSCLKTN